MLSLFLSLHTQIHTFFRRFLICFCASLTLWQWGPFYLQWSLLCTLCDFSNYKFGNGLQCFLSEVPRVLFAFVSMRVTLIRHPSCSLTLSFTQWVYLFFPLYIFKGIIITQPIRGHLEKLSFLYDSDCVLLCVYQYLWVYCSLVRVCCLVKM